MTLRRRPKLTPVEAYRATLERRLERLCRLRQYYDDDLNGFGVRLLERCISATLTELHDAEAMTR